MSTFIDRDGFGSGVIPVGANPTGLVGLTPVNGVATTFIRSDGAPALDQAIIPTWTGQHTFTLPTIFLDDVVLDADNIELQIGATQDLREFHDGTDSWILNNTGHLFASLAVSVVPANLEAVASFTVLAQRQTFAVINNANFDFTSYRNSYTSPTTPTSGATLGSFRFRAHDGVSTIYTAARMTAITSEAWTVGSAQGTALQFGNTANGAAVVVVRLSIQNDQILITGGSTAAPGGSFSADPDTGISNPVANAMGVSAAGVEVARFDNNATAGNTRFMLYDVDNGTLERVSVGAADSGGTGFKLLRIPN